MRVLAQTIFQGHSLMQVDVRTRLGTLRGVQRDKHQVFLGIPFSAPREGATRFAAPEPVAAWSGVREAREFAASCPQPWRRGVTPEGPQSEDCLYLNVYTPAADGARRPVMFWIHGGGFIAGGASDPLYDGGALCVRGNVVIVTINYRLGALGYLYLGTHGGAQPAAAANAGQLDQLAALRWVREHIAAFGGDPEQVTIFGESAGSAAVCALLATPDARGLFVRAIAQSGTANRFADPSAAGAHTDAFLAKLDVGPNPVERLRALPVETLLQAQQAFPMEAFWPIVDGRHLPERPIVAVRKGAARDIPLLIGTNRDEHKFYVDPRRPPLADAALEEQLRQLLPAASRERASELIACYRESRSSRDLPHSNNDVLDAAQTDSRFRIPATRVAAAQAEHQPNTYAYLFDWESPAYRNTMGACHALELGFVFGRLGRVAGLERLTGSGAAAERLSAQMMDAWLAFARTGDPSCEALGEWPRYEARQRQTMILGKASHVEAAPFEAERELWESLLTSGQPR